MYVYVMKLLSIIIHVPPLALSPMSDAMGDDYQLDILLLLLLLLLLFFNSIKKNRKHNFVKSPNRCVIITQGVSKVCNNQLTFFNLKIYLTI